MIPDNTNIIIGGDIEITPSREQPSRTYRLDFDSNTAIGMVDGVEAMRQAIFKIIETERFKYRIYSWAYGIELEALIGQNRSLLESEIKRILSEALQADSRVDTVEIISIQQSKRNALKVDFEVSTKYGIFNTDMEVSTNV